LNLVYFFTEISHNDHLKKYDKICSNTPVAKPSIIYLTDQPECSPLFLGGGVTHYQMTKKKIREWVERQG
jgi:hypothetical protein